MAEAGHSGACSVCNGFDAVLNLPNYLGLWLYCLRWCCVAAIALRDPPVVSDIEPRYGSSSGNTVVTVSGSRLNRAALLKVHYGDKYHWKTDDPRYTTSLCRDRLVQTYHILQDVSFPICIVLKERTGVVWFIDLKTSKIKAYRLMQ